MSDKTELMLALEKLRRPPKSWEDPAEEVEERAAEAQEIAEEVEERANDGEEVEDEGTNDLPPVLGVRCVPAKEKKANGQLPTPIVSS